MSEAVRTPVQKRDGAVQQAEPAVATITAPWTPRADDKQALLVSERTTVFDRKLAPPDETAEAIVEADPIWSNKAGTAWTPDLVHCRLVLMAETVNRLPPVLRKRYVGLLGKLALLPYDGERRTPPSPAQISLADWTLDRLYELPEATRQMMEARAFGFSFDKIVERMRANGIDAKKQTIIDWNIQTRRVMAADWQRRHHPLDLSTYERWDQLFMRRQK